MRHDRPHDGREAVCLHSNRCSRLYNGVAEQVANLFAVQCIRLPPGDQRLIPGGGYAAGFGSILIVNDASSKGFAVGTAIAGRPPLRSERARFGHSAPTLGVRRRSAPRAKDEGHAASGANRSPASPCGPT